jgi:hypothetical protein
LEFIVRLKNWIITVLVLATLAFAAVNLRQPDYSGRFVEIPIPLTEEDRLFDIGIADINGDNLFDIYTANHNFLQTLLIANSQGSYNNVLNHWGLNQSQEFPGLELSYTAPHLDKAGLYIYWLARGGMDRSGHHIIIRTYKMHDTGPWQGSLQINAPVELATNDGFQVEKQADPPIGAGTTISFSATGDAMMALKLNTWGLPVNIRINDAIQTSDIYVSNNKVSPHSNSFSMSLQDRHGLAWADYNHDGMLDVFMTRGAIGGTLEQYPDKVRSMIKDSFYISQDDKKYQNVATETGIKKEDCSGRQVKWVDFNQDGLLDLYINCQDRGKINKDFPKQLYRQDREGHFVDVASEVGLDIPDHQLIDFLWIDADNDGDAELLTSEDSGFFLYRNQSGHFAPEFIGRGKFARTDKQGLKYHSSDYWDFDGKLAAADYDNDGDPDVFCSSKKGNTFLINDAGKYSPVEPATLGLPSKSATANWVDYDNDGLPDLHTVPEGLFRQRKDHSFDFENLLVLPSRKYQAAIANWADLDNDGARDMIIGLNENPSLWPWWKKPFKSDRDIFKWDIHAYRNIARENHWLQIKLTGSKGNRQAIGASVTVVTPDGQQTQVVGHNDGAFYSQGHYRMYFGLGSNKSVKAVKIRWPDNQLQVLEDIPGDSLLVIERKPAS